MKSFYMVTTLVFIRLEKDSYITFKGRGILKLFHKTPGISENFDAGTHEDPGPYEYPGSSTLKRGRTT